MLAYAGSVARNIAPIVRHRTLAPADPGMAGRTWKFRLHDVTMELDGAHWAGGREMYGRAVYFPSPEFMIKTGERVVDVGANAGLFSLYAAKRGANVIAVEAQAHFEAAIIKNLERNGVRERVQIEICLVGAGLGTLGKLEAFQQGRVVELSTLLDKHGFDTVDFLKMDIEGSEFVLFKNPESWLPRVRRIAMEVHPAYGSVPEVSKLLRSSGFRVRVTDDRGAETETPPNGGGYLFATRSDYP